MESVLFIAYRFMSIARTQSFVAAIFGSNLGCGAEAIIDHSLDNKFPYGRNVL